MESIVRFIGCIRDKAIQIDTSEGEAQLREACPRLLQDDERVVMAFKDSWGRDDAFFTTKRVLIRDVRGLSGSCIRYQSIPNSSIKAWATDTPGLLDPDVTLKLWSQSCSLSKDFLAGQVDILAIKRHFNQYCLLGDGIGASVVGGAQATMPEPGASSNFDRLLGFIGSDAVQIDKIQLELELKQNLQILVDSETVELAFKAGRDTFILTSHRILQIDVQGLTGKKIQYLSVLWSSVKMFSVETAGAYFDVDASMVLFTDIPGLGRIQQDLRKGKVDVMAIQKFIADKLLGSDTKPSSTHAVSNPGVPDEGPGGIFAWMGNDSRMMDAAEMNEQYHSNPPILQGSETVEMAFKGRRDLMLFTTKRMIVIDIKGWSGKKVNYNSIPWKAVQCFGVRSAGAWLDKDSEMFVWTSVDDIYYPPKDDDSGTPPPEPRMSYIEIDFEKDKVDLMAIHRYLSERCLRLQGGGYLAPEVKVNPSIIKQSGNVEKFLEWVGNDARCLPASEIEQQLKSTNPMLQADEQVGMAYQAGRDMIIFTTKRVLSVDVQGWTGKKIEWKSIPYEAIRGFSVRSAGSFDLDAEVQLFTQTYWINGGPGSVFSQDLRKGKCDIIAMQSYLAAQVFGRFEGSSKLPPPLQAAPAEAPGAMESFLAWVADDASELHSETVNEHLHSAPSILQSDEKVEKAYRSGRDMTVFTTKRVLFIDVQGWTGKKVEYLSYPLRYCEGFEVQSAGWLTWFYSAHATVFADIPGQRMITQNLDAKADIWDVHAHFLAKLL
mmetsp:Transcript_44405/g.96504  ORF Transcript_44405/g.96504 Transcript_44405/m.96504 type:complete len:773 (+) Transcript_44405:115-2433(+)|eukprot:CAMPEP_0170598226 /NCGR_PEP_ID=MMETSP0224-20130122/16131_1 /TAXON_ID=285029 /ORGANISM="Togula jolla, Strain CCCM 725" /LENGTH=772 /DNA_ID=CAMNT_0010922757 /DNA_START=71 /DNA_END=2389 /DNA_ORIENTATION=+